MQLAYTHSNTCTYIYSQDYAHRLNCLYKVYITLKFYCNIRQYDVSILSLIFFYIQQVLKNILKNGPERNDYLLTIRRCSNQAKNGTEQVSIGDITVTVRPPRNVEVVPVKYLHDTPPQSVLHHLKWIMQKDGLKQDVFLIGR